MKWNPWRLPGTVPAAALILFAFSALSQAQSPSASAFDPAVFQSPPAQYRGHAMWSFNLSRLNEAEVLAGIREMAKLNYGGFFIEATAGPTTGLSEEYIKRFRMGRRSDEGVVFLSDEYFRYYKLALEEARRLGMGVILYDDYSFPTGTVAGQLFSKYRQHVAKNLNMVEKDVTGPAKVTLEIPEGIYMGAARMNLQTLELEDISAARRENLLVATIPKGRWKLMAFYLSEGRARVVDYLDSAAMDTFISMTYQKYQEHLGSYFGNLITQTFYDEPSLHHADRMWTPGFNAQFQKEFGFSPVKYYPALWYDIGPQTAAARNALFGFRGELFRRNFIRKLNDWCAARNLKFGGHLDQEEPANPTPLNGDFLKAFEHQAIPTIDDIWWYGRSNVSYKLLTSAAFLYDKPIASAETYAAYRVLDEKIAFQVAMDQFAMGINFQVPARTFQPKRAELNDYVGRLSYLLQGGRHVADVAVLYPISSLLAMYRFVGGQQFELREGERPPQIMEAAYAREGGFAHGIDYQDVGEALFRSLRVDFTYLHPEVLASRCSVNGQKLILNNRVNREEYRVLILPSGDVLSVAAAAKIKEFYDQGGKVIVTGMLPTRSAEFGKDEELRQLIYEIFGVSNREPMRADVRRAQDRQNFYVYWYFVKTNSAGGQAIFLPTVHPWLLDFALKMTLPLRDVDIQLPVRTVPRGPDYTGALTYIHKVKEGRDIYFFANSSPEAVDAKVVLRGKTALRIWNPHTGRQQEAEFSHGEAQGEPVTTLRLVLSPVSSLFFISE